MCLMERKRVVEYWLKEASEDMTVAEHLLGTGDFLYCLFLCHLFVEKTLKALVVNKTGEHAPPEHNLLLVAESAGLYPGRYREDIMRELMRFELDARYPRDREPLRRSCGEDYTKQKLAESKELARWLQSNLK
jgi:HEPN domain-containing protein